MPQNKLLDLLHKYNDVLLQSMKSAISEDLRNLIILNNEDVNLELKSTIADKKKFKEFVLQEFIKYNSPVAITKDLSSMEEVKFNINK